MEHGSRRDRYGLLKGHLSSGVYRDKLLACLADHVTIPDRTAEPRAPDERAAGDAAPELSQPRMAHLVVGSLLVLTLIGASLGMWIWEPGADAGPDDDDLRFASDPAIAVLPFTSLSGDPDDAYFAAGLTEDLISRLGALHHFPVIGSLSSSVYGGDTTDPRQIAEELDARYLVKASIGRSDTNVRVNVQLYDADSGRQIWSERYDRAFEDILAVQDEISLAVAGQMYPQLDHFDRERALRTPPPDMTAWDLAQKGSWHFTRSTRRDNVMARQAYERSLQLDPTYANAAAGLALAHLPERFVGLDRRF